VTGGMPAAWDLPARELRPALLHAHFGEDGAAALPIARHLKIPLVVTFYGHDVSRLPTPFTFRPAWLRYWIRYRALIRDTALAIAYSRHIALRLIESGWPQGKVRTHYTGTVIPGQCSYAPVPGRILALGRFVPKKGFLTLLRAMRLVRTPGAVLRLIGSGPLSAQIRSAVQRWGLGPRVELLPWQNRESLAREFREAAVIAVPSETASDGDMEGLPTVLVEAAAWGRPLIGTNHAGIPEIVRHGTNGVVVPERSPSALAQAIDTVLANPDLASQYANASRAIACSDFDLARQTARLELLYDAVVRADIRSSGSTR